MLSRYVFVKVSNVVPIRFCAVWRTLWKNKATHQMHIRYQSIKAHNGRHHYQYQKSRVLLNRKIPRDFFLEFCKSWVDEEKDFKSWVWPLWKQPVKDARIKTPAIIRKLFLQSNASTKACNVGPRIIVPSPWPAVTIPRATDRLLVKCCVTVTGAAM